MRTDVLGHIVRVASLLCVNTSDELEINEFCRRAKHENILRMSAVVSIPNAASRPPHLHGVLHSRAHSSDMTPGAGLGTGFLSENGHRPWAFLSGHFTGFEK